MGVTDPLEKMRLITLTMANLLLKKLLNITLRLSQCQKKGILPHEDAAKNTIEDSQFIGDFIRGYYGDGGNRPTWKK